MKKTIQKVLSILLCAALLCGLTPLGFAEDAPITGVSDLFTYTVNDGKATITECDRSVSGKLTIPSTIEGYPVTSIGNYAFDNCEALTGVTVPDGVTDIGQGAFKNCAKLQHIALPDGVTRIGSDAFTETAYYQNNFKNSLKQVLYIGRYLIKAKESLTGHYRIRSGTTCIADSAFFYCYILTGVTIPDSMTSIGTEAFYHCSVLKKVTVPNRVTSIGEGAFRACGSLTSLTIGSGVTRIGDYTFENCTGLTNVTIPNSVTSIGGGAFFGCTGLTSVTIPDSVTSIGDYAFENCTGLTNVTIPNSVTSIGKEAFEKCIRLTSVTIPNGVTSIGSFAFQGCAALTNVTIPASVASIGSGAFAACSRLTAITVDSGSRTYFCDGNGILYNKAQTELIQYPGGNRNTAFTVPAGVTNIGADAFYGCDALTSLTLPNSVTSIGDDAFADCSKLESVTVPASVTEIGSDILSSSLNPYIIGVPGSFAETYAKEHYIGFVSLGSGQLPIYTVTFDANGGIDAPAEQTKVRGETVTLSPEKPTREGYVFLFWSTCPVYPANVLYTTYQPGKTYSADRGIRLYAIWAPTGAAVHSVSVEDLTVYVNSDSFLKQKIDADKDTYCTVQYSSSDESVATVVGNGHVEGYKRGTATITVTVTDHNGNTVSDTCKVTVKNSPIWNILLQFIVNLLSRTLDIFVSCFIIALWSIERL